MSGTADMLGMYLHLARASGLRRRPQVRDRLLILAGTEAVEMALPRIAETCRRLVLEHNPQHLVKRWPTLEAAMREEDYQIFLRQLRRRYPREKVEELVRSLGIELGRERETYYSDEEYAAALLGLPPAADEPT